MAKAKSEASDVSELRKRLTEKYKDEELASAVTEDAVKLGTVEDILDGVRNTPTLAEAKRWLENQKKEQEAERNRVNVPRSHR